MAPDRRLDPSVRQLATSSAGPTGALPDAHRRLSQILARRHGDLRHACPCRDRGRGPAHRPDEPGELLPAAPSGALDDLAVLARPGHRPQGDRPTIFDDLPRSRPARTARRAGEDWQHLLRPWPSSACASDPTQDLVGRAAVGQAPDARAADAPTSAPGSRMRDHDRRALPSAPAPAVAAAGRPTRAGAATGAP